MISLDRPAGFSGKAYIDHGMVTAAERRAAQASLDGEQDDRSLVVPIDRGRDDRRRCSHRPGEA